MSIQKVASQMTWAIIFCLLITPSGAEDNARTGRMLKDIKYLSSDERGGRGLGTKGIDEAAEYIAAQFKAAGLKPVMPNDSYYQPFSLPDRTQNKLGEPNKITFTTSDDKSVQLELNKDFVPLIFSRSRAFKGELAFAGYGISATEYDYDDYADLDVENKVVIVIRREPNQGSQDEESPFAGSAVTRHSALNAKVRNARRHRAAALLIVNDHHSTAKSGEKLIKFGYAAGALTSSIPVASLSRQAADKILGPVLKMNLQEWEEALDKDLKPSSTASTGWNATGEINVVAGVNRVKNVLGLLEADDPTIKETIVIGAHYDHLGMGGMGSLAGIANEIHNGADDNASGTVGVLELVRRFTARESKPSKRILFMTFTAEERGLLGSRYYVNNPAIPLADTKAIVNMDMIGRLSGDKLIVYGIGTADEFEEIIKKAGQRYKFDLHPMPGSSGRSDEASFHSKKIPGLHFFTGTHPEYHRPGDDWDKISLEGMDRITSMVLDVTDAVAAIDKPLKFHRSSRAPILEGGKEKPTTPGNIATSVYFGSIPSYEEERSNGLLLSGVASGGPAAKAGLRGGDVIVKFGKNEVKNIEDLFEALQLYKPNDTVRVSVVRGTTTISYPVVLRARN